MAPNLDMLGIKKMGISKTQALGQELSDTSLKSVPITVFSQGSKKTYQIPANVWAVMKKHQYPGDLQERMQEYEQRDAGPESHGVTEHDETILPFPSYAPEIDYPNPGLPQNIPRMSLRSRIARAIFPYSVAVSGLVTLLAHHDYQNEYQNIVQANMPTVINHELFDPAFLNSLVADQMVEQIAKFLPPEKVKSMSPGEKAKTLEDIAQYLKPTPEKQCIELFSGTQKDAMEFIEAANRSKKSLWKSALQGGELRTAQEYLQTSVLYLNDSFKTQDDASKYAKKKFRQYGISAKPRAFNDKETIMNRIIEIATQEGLDPLLALSYASRESNFSQYPVSKAGAKGVFQLMNSAIIDYLFQQGRISPKDYKGLIMNPKESMKKYNKRTDNYLSSHNIDPFALDFNIQLGVKRILAMNKRFDQDKHLGAAAYNAGAGNVEKYGRTIPPFKETRRYVPAVVDENYLDGKVLDKMTAQSPQLNAEVGKIN